MGKFTGKRGRAGYTPEPTPGDRPWVLAHGQPTAVVLISDDCSIDDALGIDRDRRPQGRLLFASLERIEKSTYDDLIAMPAFDRLPISAHSGTGFEWVDLSRQFMVDVRDVDLDNRTGWLGADDTRELLVRLGAYGCRRGPLSALRNAERFAQFLAGGKDSTPSDAVRAACIQAAGVVGWCWTLEGESLDRAGEALEIGGDRTELIADLNRVLRSIAANATEAARLLEGVATG
jgi:hypothetical protein